MSSTATHESPHRQLLHHTSSSETKMTTAKFTHTWTIDRFSLIMQDETTEKGKFPCVESSKFGDLSNGLEFSIDLHPFGENAETKDFISIRVCSHQKKLKLFASVSIMGPTSHYKNNTFANWKELLAGVYWGWGSFVKREILFKNTGIVLPNDKLTVKCEIEVIIDVQTSLKQASNDAPFQECTKPRAGLQKYLDDNKFSDLVLNVNGTTFKAHKNILAARSPVFAAMFDHEHTKEARDGRIYIEGVDTDVFQSFLRHLYTGTVEECHKLHALSLLAIADRYEVLTLKTFCAEYMIENLSISNAVDTFIFADLHNVDVLKKKSLEYISSNLSEIMKLQNWSEVLENQPKLYIEMFSGVFELKHSSPTTVTAPAAIPSPIQLLNLTVPRTQESTSEIKMVSAKFVHTWTIDRFSVYTEFEKSANPYSSFASARFGLPAEDYEFCLFLYPQGKNEQTKDSIGIFVHSYRGEHKINFQLYILRQNGSKYLKRSFVRKFPISGFGWYSFAKHDELLANGSLPNDKLTICCEIEIITDNATAASVPQVPNKVDLAVQACLDQVGRDLGSLYSNHRHTDIVLSVGGKELAAHRNILIARSPVFAKKLLTKKGQKFLNISQLEITDSEPDVLEEFLRYLYSYEISDECLELYAPRLYELAETYKIKPLMDLCSVHLGSKIAINTAISTLVFASKHNAFELREKAMNFVISHFAQIKSAPNWNSELETRPQLLTQVFQRVLAPNPYEVHYPYSLLARTKNSNNVDKKQRVGEK